MSDYTKVVLEGDAKGRVSISALDDKNCGHGYRLAGQKYVNDIIAGITTPVTFRVELGAEEVDELHHYLRTWDEINLGDQSPEWGLLVKASDRYRQTLGVVAKVKTYRDFPAGRLAELEGQSDQARWQLGQAAAALGAALGYRAEQP